MCIKAFIFSNKVDLSLGTSVLIRGKDYIEKLVPK